MQLILLKLKSYIDDRTNQIIKYYEKNPSVSNNKIIIESVAVNRNLNYSSKVP